VADAKPVAILTALEEELEGIRRALPDLAGVELIATGDGPKRAASGAARFLERHRPSAVIGAGLAGAISPGLAVGDIVASRRVRFEVGDTATPDARLLERALAAGAMPGTLITVARPAVSHAARAALAGTVAGGDALAVDMESAAWAREAAARGIPYLVVRIVSDAADEDLPAFLPDCVGPDGSIRRGEVARRALLQPSSWGTLLRMRRRLHECSDALGAFLKAMDLSGIVGAGPDPARWRPPGPPLR
jgi:adenosylhomocysteine nucleosidase